MDKSCGNREFCLPHSQQGGWWVWDSSLPSLPLCIPQGDEGIVGMRGPPGMMVSVPEKKNHGSAAGKIPTSQERNKTGFLQWEMEIWEPELQWDEGVEIL